MHYFTSNAHFKNKLLFSVKLFAFESAGPESLVVKGVAFSQFSIGNGNTRLLPRSL